ncbi:cadherin domain-containing protein [Dapis sp. BLCC M172]|uniref:cadherin domain-containing protein n=1 Tax=Dapis sp. BLCC M172 TaxID=2975281 RepID=UPI003CE6993A
MKFAKVPILVANSSLLDFENNTAHTINIRTTDSGTPTESFEQQLTIDVTDVDETPTPSNNPPTEIQLDNHAIAENSNNGTVVGTLTTTDSDVDDTHTYTLLNDGDGRFVVDGDRILVANSSLLDFENNTAHTINIRTTDSGTPTESFEQQLTIDVTDVDETLANNNNTLGTPNSDRLIGTNNGDTLSGGEGNDTYIINNTADIIIEDPNAGIDAAESSITYSLPGNVENLVLTGENIDGSGNPRNNYIAGSDGNNKLGGGRGNDTLLGVGGADTIIGGKGNDILLGGAGDDILQGRPGRDRLNGGAGNDTLTGGASKDKFIFNTNQPFQAEDIGTDTITDFQEDRDKILLDQNTFTAINSLAGEGFSIVEEFEVVSSDAQAETAVGVIVYNQTNGNLFYNSDGVASGFGEGGLFANVVNAPELESSDFQIR